MSAFASARGAVFALLLSACCPCRETASPAAPLPSQSSVAPSAEAAPPTGDRPRVVVAVVVDQLGAEELLRAEPLLDPQGALGRAVREGTYFERARYPYAGTLTAPGHASLFTGVPPRRHGVSANELWDYATRTQRAATVDPRGVVLGFPGSAGPAGLRSETVAESLQRASGGRAKAFGFSLKERGAIFSLGRGGTAFWYESADGSFTTSAAYAKERPQWLTLAEQANPIAALLVPWTPLVPAGYAAVRGPDDQPWESDLGGFGRSFPHDPKGTKTPLSTLRFMPALGERVLELGRAAIEAEGLGTDAVPDLMVFSLSGLDYAGHAFGAGSWEYLDHVLRVDRSLGQFMDWLGQRGPTALILSADHGTSAPPEALAASEPTAMRVYTLDLVARLETHLKERFGAGPWVDACLGSFLYLSDAAKRRNDVLDAAEQWLGGVTGLARVFRVAELEQVAPGDALRERVKLSVGRDIAADFYLVQNPHVILDGMAPPGVGSHHGSPYPYDTDVPLLVWGSSVPTTREKEPVDALRFAATLAELLGVPPPVEAAQPSLL